MLLIVRTIRPLGRSHNFRVAFSIIVVICSIFTGVLAAGRSRTSLLQGTGANETGGAIPGSAVGPRAQNAPPSPFVATYSPFTLKLPVEAIRLVGLSRIGSKTIGIVDVAIDGRGQAVPNGHPDWAMMGMPALGEFWFVKSDTANGRTEVEYRNSQFYLKFRFRTSMKPEDAISPFLIRGLSSSVEAVSYWNERRSAITAVGVAALQESVVRGTVTDPVGWGLPGARVTATSGAIVRSVITERDGTYALMYLPPGKYILEPMFQGFKRQTRSITVNREEALTANFVLEVPPSVN